MVRQPHPLPPALRGAAFAYRDARDAGVSRRRLGRPDIAHPHRGMYISAEIESTTLIRCRSLAPLLSERQRFSHATAARLWGMPLPVRDGPDQPLHVIAVRGAEPMRRAGVIGWETEDDPGLATLGRLQIVSASRTWAQLAVPGAVYARRRALSVDWLVAVGDFLLTGPRRGVPLCTRTDLDAAARAHRGKRGAKALQAALALVRPGPQSPRESLLRVALLRQGLPEPDIQVPVQTSAGIRHADLGYPAARLLIEYQGDHHRTDQAQWREDLTRIQLFEDAGCRTIAVTAAEFSDDCAALAARIRRALARA